MGKSLRDSILAVDHKQLKGSGIVLDHSNLSELRPTELHHIADGAKDDTPSFVIVLEDRQSPTAVIGQISLRMLTKALDELGYELKAKPNIVNISLKGRTIEDGVDITSITDDSLIGETLGEFRESTRHLPDNTPICGIDHFGGRENLSRIVIKDDGKWIGIDYYKGEGPD